MRDPNGEAIDEDVELELIEHEGRSVEAHADSAEEDHKKEGDESSGLVLEEVDYRELGHVGLLYAEFIVLSCINYLLLR